MGRSVTPAIVRAMTKVLVGDQCWDWTAATYGNGYGCIGSGGRGARNLLAHRLFYETMVGPIPSNMEIDHLCRNRRCVRPKHMEVVDHRTNTLRGDTITGRQARQTHCKRGHLLSGYNLIVSRNGKRWCRTCQRSWQSSPAQLQKRRVRDRVRRSSSGLRRKTRSGRSAVVWQAR